MAREPNDGEPPDVARPAGAETAPSKAPNGISRKTLLRRALVGLAASVGSFLFGARDEVFAEGGRRTSSPTHVEERSQSLGALHDTKIVSCAIHPGIGIVRVGNSPTHSFIGPEVPGLPPNQKGAFKDPQGRIKRQAARFRIYGLNKAGQVVKELTAGDADIIWTVHVANKKAAWYQFKIALDLPQVLAQKLPPLLRSGRRNADVKGANRRKLVIDPGPRSIRGRNIQGPNYRFDSGSFMRRKVALGEIRTDAAGRLLVLGGFGTSGTTKTKNPPVHIANNDGWHDDTSDGPVSARVMIHGKHLPVTSAWVIVAPPDYAPGIIPVITLYDIVQQAFLDGHPSAPPRVSFTHGIYPILLRFDNLQWVNEGFYRGYGWKGQIPFLDPTLLTQLSSNSLSTGSVRQQMFNRFRDPNYHAVEEDAWPRLYGDDFNQPPQSPRQYQAVTREQYRRLQEWARGNFIADWNPEATPLESLAEVPLKDRPAALDRAALESCSGGPFHPGEEVGWPMRHSSMYSAFGRIRERRKGDPRELNYGNVLSPKTALGPKGPLHRNGPGDLTRWMAVPWQTDASNCGSAYPNSTLAPPPLPDLPTFWPAIVPNRVLTQAVYMKLLDATAPLIDREAAFNTRVSWARHLPTDYFARNKMFIKAWRKLGFITEQPGPSDSSFPSAMWVESESGFKDTRVSSVEGRATESVEDRRSRL